MIYPNRQVDMFGIRIDAVNMVGAVESVMDFINCDDGICRYVVTPNVDHTLMLQHNEALRRAYAGAALVLADGAPVVAASRLLKKPLPERVTGADLVYALFDAAKETRPLRVYLMGSAPGVAEVATEVIHKRWPAVKIVGTSSPMVRVDRIDENADEVLRDIEEASPDVLVVGLEAPKQEMWAHAHRNRIKARVALCVGATIDFLAGAKPRAPLWMQNNGLEWLYRMLKEPRRLTGRYARDAVGFPKLVWREWRNGRKHTRTIHARVKSKPAPTEVETIRGEVDFDPIDLSTGATETTSVAVIVPCYNEEAIVDQLGLALERVESALDGRYRAKFYLVDDGSLDGTLQALKETFCDKPNCEVLGHDRNRGVAAAIMTGIRASDAEIVCSIDADCSYAEQLAGMIPLLEDGVDMVTASPYHPEGEVLNVVKWRLAISQAASFLYRRVLRQKLYTYTSCFRVYRRDTVAEIELENDGFVGIAELVWQLDRKGARVVEFPAVLGAREEGQSKLKLMPTVASHLRLLNRALWLRLRNGNAPVGRTSEIDDFAGERPASGNRDQSNNETEVTERLNHG